jgi:hypothetical protein
MPSGPTKIVAHKPGAMQSVAMLVLASVSQCHGGSPILA